VALRDGTHALTYGELDTAADLLASHLRARGVGPETAVGVHIERSTAFVTAVLAVLKAGGAFLPLQPSHPAARLGYMRRDAGTHLVLTTSATPTPWDPDPGDVPVDRTLTGPSVAPPLPPSRRPAPGRDTPADDLASIFYTSGSTGAPKGVLLTHASIVSRGPSKGIADDLSPRDIFLFKSPVTFSSILREIFWPLSLGASIVIAPPGSEKSPRSLLDLATGAGVTVALLVPSQLRMLVEESTFRDWSSLRHVVVGGETVAPNLPTRFFASSHAHLHQIYGATEATTSTHHRFDRANPGISTVIGPPANLQVLVLDESRRPVPVGTVGEIYAGGPGVARGYLNSPELTADKFVQLHPLAPADIRFYKTGDHARVLPSGELEFVGRADQQIKIRGCRVELSEVKRCLCVFPAVEDVEIAVEESAEGDHTLVAYLVLKKGALDPTVEDLDEHVRTELPDYMVPRAYVFLTSFPVTELGKLDLGALPAPGRERPRMRVPCVAPATPVEATLVDVWRELLGLDRIGVSDDFFALGGDSFLAVAMLGEIEDRFGTDVDMTGFFTTPTIETMAQALDAGTAPPPR
jgi:amino acid adenylation domain-containing protein